MPQEVVGYVPLEWLCPKCQSRNPGPETFCQSCGAAQPPDVEFVQAQGQAVTQDEALQKIAAAGPDIHCPYCGARNRANAAICARCGGDLSTGVQREAGQVLGALDAAPVRTINCPRCHTPNPETNLKCTGCGAPLPASTSLIPVQAAPGMPTWVLYAILALILLCLCLGGWWLVSAATSSTSAAGAVASRQWQTVVQVVALAPVTHETWQDNIPSGGELGQCRSRVRDVLNYAPANRETRKVCGTPYTVNTGSGVGKVVQDCQYEVYDQYCSYTVMEWRVVNQLTQRGQDAAPLFAQPQLTGQQRLGERQTHYQVVFQTGTSTYTYEPATLEEYRQFAVGSQWLLSINGFGKLVGVKPK